MAKLTRILLAAIVKKDFHASHMDVRNAFIHGEIEQELYMKVPTRFETESNLVCKLNKTLYGLKEALRAWNKIFNNFITCLGFRRSEIDKCLCWNLKLIVFICRRYYHCTNNNKSLINQVKKKLRKKFRMKDLGKLQSFLDIDIERFMRITKLHLNQLFKETAGLKMEDCNPTRILWI